MSSFDVLPLRAVLFQLLFLVTAIALESMVLRNRLGIGRKISIQFAATTNLLSTVIGWMLFFIVEPLLSPELRSQLISYIFFDLTTNPPLLIGLAFISFIATFLVKLEGITWLELLLGMKKDVETEARATAKFQGRRAQRAAFATVPNRPLAVLWANAISFSAITLLIGIRLLFDQTFGTF
ncbi:filament integrity protein fraC [Phormidesmis priestleyi ULC007]|uniref:Filament integrity protein fraC n=1 Tax=Phormidesmis priestleyi ULC007 TaxID=1920490 RepID=A0A2T1DB56_9CYAN|nr:filament integrity protein FraC [Phormidesmis priestleyi]PSB17728.1 filament integrity protein fraC [Phormidesmis priestleyi ULC007]PZO48669.1 MAG: filament integrity protein fraC [Phormidesmis priestleyi]